jgi:protein tyrosine phosphatase (PTP) superfamily phosphohydrolase (DUF442 family)
LPRALCVGPLIVNVSRELVIERIYNFKQVSDNLATSGQPNADELAAIVRAGYNHIVYLGLENSESSLPDEIKIIESLGAKYHHIPVSFENPELERYLEFEKLLSQLESEKIFIHCVANKRVSVFAALLKIVQNQFAIEQAITFIESIWHPNATWKIFFDRVLEQKGVKVNDPRMQ